MRLTCLLTTRTKNLFELTETPKTTHRNPTETKFLVCFTLYNPLFQISTTKKPTTTNYNFCPLNYTKTFWFEPWGNPLLKVHPLNNWGVNLSLKRTFLGGIFQPPFQPPFFLGPLSRSFMPQVGICTLKQG